MKENWPSNPDYQLIISDEAELPAVVQKVLDLANGKKKWFFHGEIGAGKTTFIKVLTKLLHSDDLINSPTFSIVNEYWNAGDSLNKIFHIDLFRITSFSEALDIGIEDYLENEHFCFIEWPEIIEPILPDNGLWLYLHILDHGIRQLDISIRNGSN